MAMSQSLMAWQGVLSHGVSEWNPHFVDYGSTVLRRPWPFETAAKTMLEGPEAFTFPDTITSFIVNLKCESVKSNGSYDDVFCRDEDEALVPSITRGEPMRKKRLDFQGVLLKARKPFVQPKRNHKMQNWKSMYSVYLAMDLKSFCNTCKGSCQLRLQSHLQRLKVYRK
jgi:hypothetical protein